MSYVDDAAEGKDNSWRKIAWIGDKKICRDFFGDIIVN